MKLLSTLTLASLLVAGSAFAADAAGTATAPKPTAAATATAKVDHHCRDDANGKKLAGAARKSFMKKCLADARAAK